MILQQEKVFPACPRRPWKHDTVPDLALVAVTIEQVEHQHAIIAEFPAVVSAERLRRAGSVPAEDQTHAGVDVADLGVRGG